MQVGALLSFPPGENLMENLSATSALSESINVSGGVAPFLET